jgi:hypothetical protein
LAESQNPLKCLPLNHTYSCSLLQGTSDGM